MDNSETKAHLKKMRVQLFDGGLNQVEDRLVSQDTELRKGPIEAHKGPIKLEVCLFEKEDIDKVIEYINQLVGYLPIELATKKPKRVRGEYSDDKSWREDLKEEILSLGSQDEMIAKLREEGFIFMTSEHLSDAGILEEALLASVKDYQWMIKLIKEAKNPQNNKYDPLVLFGFKLLGEKTETVHWLLDRTLSSLEGVPWKKANKVTFKKSDMAKFPPYMLPEEREKFRGELYKARKDPPNHIFSKFFLRWYKDVEFREKDEWAETLLK